MTGLHQFFAGAGGIVLLGLLIKAALILGIAWLLARLSRRGSAALRHGIWAVALAGVVCIPFISPWLPPLKVGIEIPSPGASPELAPLPRLVGSATGEVPAPQPDLSSAAVLAAPSMSSPAGNAAAPPAEQSGRNWIGWLELFLLVWAVGALARLLWFANQLRRVRWLSGHTPPEIDSAAVRLAEELAQRLGIRRSVCVLESSWASMPLTWGVLRPVVLLPEESSTWPLERLRVVLLHELGHIRRWDYLIYVVAELACALYWPLPLVWLARAHVQKEQEQACDDLVLVAGTGPVEYAEHLLAVARSFYGNRWELGATVTMAREVSLKHRVRTILDATTNRRPALSGYGLLVLLLLSGFALPVAAIRPGPAESDAADEAPAEVAADVQQDVTPPNPASRPEVLDEEALVASTRLWMEAEDGHVAGPMEIREDLTASSGGYAVVPDGRGNDAPEGGEGQVVFAFEVPATGEYVIWGRVIGAHDNDNSFYVSIDGGDERRWDVEDAAGGLLAEWGWIPLRDPAAGPPERPMGVHLAAGAHTLRIRNREDGTLLDRLLITGDPAYVPRGRGADLEGYRPTYRWMEVERAQLEGSVAAVRDERASGGHSIVFRSAQASDLSGSASFAFDVEAGGRYVVWGRIFAPHDGANSFYASLDGGEEVIWDAPAGELGSRAGRWFWVPLNARDYHGRTVDPLLIDLQPGRHVLRLRTREPGVRLDGLLVTDDLGFQPRGTWPVALPARPVTVWLEAESALLHAPFLVRSDEEAAGGFYLQVEDGRARMNPPGAGSHGSAILRFTVPEAGIYNFWARTRAHSGRENSFWVRVNDGAWVRWNEFPKDGAWRWSMVHDEDRGGEVAQFHLAPGENRLEFAAREGGARIDRVMISNDPLADPENGLGR